MQVQSINHAATFGVKWNKQVENAFNNGRKEFEEGDTFGFLKSDYNSQVTYLKQHYPECSLKIDNDELVLNIPKFIKMGKVSTNNPKQKSVDYTRLLDVVSTLRNEYGQLF